MKAICELTTPEHDALSNKYKVLLEKTKGVSKSELFELFTKKPGYAHYVFDGYVSNKLIDLLGRMPDEDEIIMLVDGGFSHFGARCRFDTGRRHFHGRVNTD